MKYALLKSTALGALLAAGLATGGMAAETVSTDTKGPDTMGNNTHAATKADAHINTDITWDTVMGTTVMTADDEEVGRIINVYQPADASRQYVIIDRGDAYDANARFVPVSRESLSMGGDRTVVVTTTRSQFDTAPAYSATTVNERDVWPERVDSYWNEKYVSSQPINVTASGRVSDGTSDLSTFSRTYSKAGGQPSN
ncbi:MAG: PRC-barrel domain-containing protein [Sneathiellaceae bacterium]